MPKYSVKVVVDYEDILSPTMTQAKRNELLRDLVHNDLKQALKRYGLESEILEVRKVQNV